jgi:sulfide:quinone oxidoreductase
MAHVIVMGAGIGGLPMAYELREILGANERITVIGLGDTFHFVPSNPWLAVNWRERDQIEFPIAPYLERKNIVYDPRGVKRVHPADNRVELLDGTVMTYDYLVIATGPKLAFDEVPGLGPNGHTASVCHVDHAEAAAGKWHAFVSDPGPIVVGAVQGASCFGPAYEFAFIESMVTATAHNIRDALAGQAPTHKATWNAVCLADLGDSGIAFVALPQIPPRNVNWFSQGKWVHVAKVAFEKYFIRKMKKGNSEPVYEKYVMGALGIAKLKTRTTRMAETV